MARSEKQSLLYAVETSAFMIGVLALAGLLTFLIPELRGLGIAPRTFWGLLGVVFGPLLHANAAHLLANATPLFVLLVLLFWDKRYYPARTLALIWLASGLGTWLIGRSGVVHIGASGMVYGLVSYLVAAGFFMRSWRAAFIALLVFVLYGGAAYGILPRHGPISWEGHLCGALAGIWAARHNQR